MTILCESPSNGPGVVRYGLKGKLEHELRLDVPCELPVASPKPAGGGASGSASNAGFPVALAQTRSKEKRRIQGCVCNGCVAFRRSFPIYPALSSF